jgi:hypothetical protein
LFLFTRVWVYPHTFRAQSAVLHIEFLQFRERVKKEKENNCFPAAGGEAATAQKCHMSGAVLHF